MPLSLTLTCCSLTVLAEFPKKFIMIGKLFKAIIGSKNEREVKKLRPLVARINEIETSLQNVPEEELRKKTADWKARLSAIQDNDELAAALLEIMPEAFAVVKNACRRLCGKDVIVRGHPLRWEMVPFDVQLIGGMALHKGHIAEMATGEGKTLVATLPVYLNALTGRGVHVEHRLEDVTHQTDARSAK